MMSRLTLLAAAALFLTLLLAGGCASSQPAATQAPPAARGGADSLAEKYREVIPLEAESDSGLFVVHRVEEKLFYEIPDSLLGRDMLLVSRLAQVPRGLGAYLNAGRKVAERAVRWTREGRRLLLKPVSFESVAADSLPIAQSVRVNTFEPILGAFEIAARNPETGAAVIEVTELFTEDVPALSGFSPEAREEWGVRGFDAGRSFINYAHSYPQNVDVRHTLTFRATEGPAASTGALSVQLHQSMVLLPADLMTARPCDVRVGYFDVERIDYGSDRLGAAEECFITRWRLVPSDPEAYARGELVEPVEPIVFYLDRAVPDQWRPYFEQGIEDWNRAFEAAGFTNAIVARDAPTEEENPDWNAEDARYSVVRYVASTTRNAMGPSVVDPRSGEIIESDIIWYHNHLRSYRNRLMIETGAANPEARSLNHPEALIGETMRQVIAHEVGHAIGLPHNMVASAAYPVDSLRSPTFTAEYGVAASIMDYARQNYIAQPGDGVERFIRKIGPYDLHAVEWGYRRFPTMAPEAREERLDEMILAHVDDPMYQFLSGYAAYLDPRAQTEDLGADHVKASGYAVENLKRVVPNLAEWAALPGEDYDDLEQIYGELLGMWSRYMGHVAGVVGGVYADPKLTNQDGPVYTPVPRAEQERAVQFLADQAFDPPTWLLEEEVLQRIEPASTVEHMRELQGSVLENVLSPSRMQRLVEAEALHPDVAYPLPAFMTDVRSATWSELEAANPQIGVYRQHLQRAYIEHLVEMMEEGEEEEEDMPSALRPVVRRQLVVLEEETQEAAGRAEDLSTRLHLEDAAARIEEVLAQEE